MRASKAYIAGVGTTGVLVGSALLLLVVVSTLVAFQGWPGTGLEDDIESLVVDRPERQPVEGPVRVALNAASAAAAVAQAPAPRSAAAGGAGVAPPRGVVDARDASFVPPLPVDPNRGEGFREPDGEVDPGDPQPPDPGPPRERGGLLPDRPLTAQVNEVTTGLGNTTQSVTDGLGYTVGGLNPLLGNTVSDAGRALADLIRSLGQPRR
ncbi:MAG TPA: hypothetical protein VGV10_01590 [Thermoleophilaceae bacterium]|nr:hypothetical protein [Thermoleophilaceae bacterium]